MSSAWARPARTLAAQVAVITLVGLGVASPALAGPNDAASDNGKNAAAGATQGGGGAGGSGGDSARSGGNGGSASTDKARPTGGSGGDKANDPADHQTDGTAGTRGEPPAEQPLSNADQNEGGANGECDQDQGPYCGTERDKPSANGNGGGEATGKPCAGCVGAADNKNPKGQYPNAANDGNNGYECDGNNGIAKGNPAHTGCDTTVAPPPPPPGGETCPDGSPLPPSGNPADCGGGVTPPGGETCPDGSPLPPSGNPADCGGGVIPPGGETCPDGSPLPPSGNPADCETVVVPPNPPTPPNIGGEETPPGANRPPTVAGVETMVGPAAAVPGAPAGVLPATGAEGLTSALAGLALLLLLAGTGTLLFRRAEEH